MTCIFPVAQGSHHGHPAMLDPWEMARDWGTGTVLAVLTATHGPAYRNPGAAMVIAPDGHFAGAITSGCIEADLILRAEEVRRSGMVQNLRYGEGSPFFDLRLPCGGAVEIRLFPLRDPDVLGELAEARRARRTVSLQLSGDGRLSLADWRPTARESETFHLAFRPDLRFLIFGTGAEAAAFAGLVRGLGYDHLLLSHDEASLLAAQTGGSTVRLLTSLSYLDSISVDPDTAVVLFYHDHDYEPEILRRMLATPAFYIGAQGSRATQVNRLMRLRELGVSLPDYARVRGPIGLVPASRDPRSLAISVLAEIVGLRDSGSEVPSGISTAMPASPV